MQNKPSIILRADGNSNMGLGHIYRLLSFISILEIKYDLIFAIRELSTNVRKIFHPLRCKLIEIKDDSAVSEEIDLLKKIPTNFIILDGYHFDTEYQKRLIENGFKVICIDDIQPHHFKAHAIINHSGGVKEKQFSKELYTKIFIGPRYAILRESFRRFSSYRSYPENRNSIFLCLGGADPHNYTLRVLKDLEKENSNSNIKLVIGSAYAHLDVLNSYLKTSLLEIELYSQIDEGKMVDIMAQCKIAITSASTIAFEYLSIGGLLYLLDTVDNQKKIYRFLIKEKLAFPYDHGKFNHTEIDSFIVTENQIRIFDGRSGDRLLDICNQVFLDEGLSSC